MKAFLREMSNRMRAFVHKEPLDRQLDEELASHVDMAVEENLRSGMSAEEARRQALIRVGGVQQAGSGSAKRVVCRGWMCFRRTSAPACAC